MEFDALLSQWLPRQRWFRADQPVPISLVDSWTYPTVRPGVHVATTIVTAGELHYHVPLVFRTVLPADTTGLVGTYRDGDAQHFVFDAIHDVAGVCALLEEFHWLQDPPAAPQAVRVLGGEMSNSCLVLDGPNPLIIKVFRVLADGENPDITIQRELRGHAEVPRLAGWLDRAGVSLAIASEFIPNATDAWRRGLELGATNSAWDLHGLGVTTARLHGALLDTFGSFGPDPRRLREHLLARAQWAASQVPQIAAARDLIVAHLEQADLGQMPRQRIHGDYHLGQVLTGGDNGWVVLDFEGEPLRPLAERTVPDYALRDVAAMLRSVDYARAQLAAQGHGVGGWLTTARTDFLAGYVAGGGADPAEHAGLLAALELDKALYEAVYERVNRPSWLHIPLAAIGATVPGTAQFMAG